MSARWYVFWRERNSGGIPAQYSKLHRQGGIPSKTWCGIALDDPDLRARGVRRMKRPPKGHKLTPCGRCESLATRQQKKEEAKGE